MFGSLSFNEILFILVLALLIFGPKRLPQIGRTLGKTLGEFRRATSDLKRSMEVEMTMAEERETATGAPKPRLAEGTEARGDSVSDAATYGVAGAAGAEEGGEPGGSEPAQSETVESETVDSDAAVTDPEESDQRAAIRALESPIDAPIAPSEDPAEQAPAEQAPAGSPEERTEAD